MKSEAQLHTRIRELEGEQGLFRTADSIGIILVLKWVLADD